jgi:hypothetical protein
MIDKSVKKGLVVAVIFLFVAVSFQPVFAKDAISPMKKSDTKELLETIKDLANNQEIQKIIQKYESKKSILGFQYLNVNFQKEINSVIEKNDSLEKLSDFSCNCEKDNNITSWSFPVICTLLIPLWIYGFYLDYKYGKSFLVQIISNIGLELNCYWRV